MTNIGRKPSCLCGVCEKCKRRTHARERYQKLTIEERRALIARRDPETTRANDRARYYRDRAHRIALMVEWAQNNPERSREIKRKWAERNPEKIRARNRVNNAIRDGKIVRLACEVCGVETSQAHHDDYSRPLDVRWLCSAHHGERHRQYKEDAA